MPKQVPELTKDPRKRMAPLLVKINGNATDKEFNTIVKQFETRKVGTDIVIRQGWNNDSMILDVIPLPSKVQLLIRVKARNGEMVSTEAFNVITKAFGTRRKSGNVFIRMPLGVDFTIDAIPSYL